MSKRVGSVHKFFGGKYVTRAKRSRKTGFASTGCEIRISIMDNVQDGGGGGGGGSGVRCSGVCFTPSTVDGDEFRCASCVGRRRAPYAEGGRARLPCGGRARGRDDTVGVVSRTASVVVSRTGRTGPRPHRPLARPPGRRKITARGTVRPRPPPPTPQPPPIKRVRVRV